MGIRLDPWCVPLAVVGLTNRRVRCGTSSLGNRHQALSGVSDSSPYFVREVSRGGFETKGGRADDIKATLAASKSIELLQQHGVAPPVLLKNGARSLIKRLCDAAELAIDREYTKPHGGRRGLGSDLYAQDAELAQELLRHESVETSHESYRE